MDKAVKSLKTGNKYLRHLVANIGNGARIGWERWWLNGR
jgi:hypothetical protein